MRKYILYNPAISSLNKGDEIISESCKNHLKGIIKEDDFTCEICTHLPLVNYYLQILGEPAVSFVLGSNLLGGKMNKSFKQWYVTLKNLDYMKNVVLMGVGWRTYNELPNIYTKHLYRNLLNKGYLHSVRDEYTQQVLESIGITNVINTGCPTMWSLTKDHCAMIPTKKSDTVVFTLTDYRRNETRDKALINTLIENYNKIYFWIQGSGDDAYFDLLTSQMQTSIVKINQIKLDF